MQNRRRVIASVAVVAAAAVTAGGVAGLALSGASTTTDPSPSSVGRPSAAGAPNAPVGSASDSATSRPGTSGAEPVHGRRSGSGRGGRRCRDAAGDTGRHAVRSARRRPASRPRTALPTWDDLGPRPSRRAGDWCRATRPAAARRRRARPSSPAACRRRRAGSSSRWSPDATSPRRPCCGSTAPGWRGPASTEQAVAAVGGASAAAFIRGGNRVVVTVDPGRAQTYSVLGHLRHRQGLRPVYITLSDRPATARRTPDGSAAGWRRSSSRSASSAWSPTSPRSRSRRSCRST